MNVEALKNLKRFEIPISKENIEKFVAIKETLESLKENLNFESIAKLEKAGYDIDSMSIWEVKSAVEKVLISEIDMNLEILKSQAKKELSYDEARKILEQAKEADLQAHTVQTKLIQAEMSGSGNKPEVGLLMVHAQDHYMTSQLARDLIEELINVFEAKEGK